MRDLVLIKSWWEHLIVFSIRTGTVLTPVPNIKHHTCWHGRSSWPCEQGCRARRLLYIVETWCKGKYREEFTSWGWRCLSASLTASLWDGLGLDMQQLSMAIKCCWLSSSWWFPPTATSGLDCAAAIVPVLFYCKSPGSTLIHCS